jgi:hypothetical protein
MDFLQTLLLTVTFLSFFAHAQISSDTIKPGNVILPSEMLVSENGMFRFGFQSRLGGATYLVIFYLPSVVGSYTGWVASEHSFLVNGNLTMEEDGVLKIFYDEGSLVILNPNRATPNSIGTIENSGNFRVKELNPDGSISRVLWESFDYPSDTLLPGMKLWMDFETNQKSILTSWISGQIPSFGGFSLEWSPNANGTGQLVMRHRSNIYWVSRIGNDSHFPNFGMMAGGNYKFNYVSNKKKSYFTYFVLNGSFSAWTLGFDRQLMDLKAQLVFLNSSLCFFKSSDRGCMEKNTPNYRNSEQRFREKWGAFHNRSYCLDDDSSLNINDGWAQCRNNCSCFGFTTATTNETGCRFYNNKFVEVKGPLLHKHKSPKV